MAQAADLRQCGTWTLPRLSDRAAKITFNFQRLPPCFAVVPRCMSETQVGESVYRRRDRWQDSWLGTNPGYLKKKKNRGGAGIGLTTARRVIQRGGKWLLDLTGPVR